MIDEKICGWLMDNADTPIRYRVARELLRDAGQAKRIEGALLEHPVAARWLRDLKPEIPPMNTNCVEHGSFDFCLENAMLKAVRLGLHGGMPRVSDAVRYYVDDMKNAKAPYRDARGQPSQTGRPQFAILTANILSLAGIADEHTRRYMMGSLDEMYNFVKQKIYEIYLDNVEKSRLTSVPKVWKNSRPFIKPELVGEYGFGYPLIYDIVGMHMLYSRDDPAANAKIDDIIAYISTDEFHEKTADGYGILVDGGGAYHSMGWDPKYPGWFDAGQYINEGNMARLLFFAEHIAKYPPARRTGWFTDLLGCLEKYRTDAGTYVFPGGWLKESVGYAVMGFHMSFGENRRGKNWREIESTFYMQLLLQNAA